MTRPVITEQARQVAENYRHMGRSIQRDAFLARVAGRTVDADAEDLGRRARLAAISEEIDAEPKPRPCSICGGEAICIGA